MNARELLILTRIDLWWRRSIALIWGIIFLCILSFHIEFNIGTLGLTIALAMSIIGFVGFANILTEYYNEKLKDEHGQMNLLIVVSNPAKKLAFLFALLCTLVPWFIIPVDRILLTMFVGTFFLLLSYGLPWINFKSIPIVSTIIRTLYEFVLPSAIIYWTLFSLKREDLFLSNGLFLWAWIFTLGLRTNLIQEINSTSFRAFSKGESTVVFLGVKLSKLLFASTLFLEPLFFVLAVFGLLGTSSISLVLVSSFILVVGTTILLVYNRNEIAYFVLNEYRFIYDKFYQYFLPILLVVLLAIFSDVKWSFFLMFIVPFFFKDILTGLKSVLSFALHIVFIVFHHLVSRVLLIFGIDLKKRNQTVLEFFGIKKMRE